MSITKRLDWIIRRASVVSAPEIGYRLGRLAARRARRLAAALGLREPTFPVAGSSFVRARERQLFVPPLAPSPEDEQRIVDGQVPLYGRWIAWRDDPLFWHTDHLFGGVWPRQRTGTIAYRPGNPIGDVRVVWELNRLQHLVLLAKIAADDPERRDRAVRLLDAQLRSWLVANPPGIGVNHASAMERALRILALTHAADLARAYLPEQLLERVGELAVGDATEVEGRLSLYSSAGNHTIAEAVGLLYAGLLFPEHPRAARWRRVASTLLRAEGTRQVQRDGGGLEQATWYLLFVTDLLGLASAALRHRGEPPVPELDGAAVRARGFLHALATSPRDLPPIGDGDGGYALSPLLRLSWPRRDVEPPVAREFPETGLTVVAPGDGDRLVFVHGGLGMPPSCGHGHADCLSVLFRHRGVDLLIDPGTYLYGGPAALRRYFRSTAAHNTVLVAGRDQAEQIAPFMWKGSYRGRVVLGDLGSTTSAVLARHDAYRAYRVTHWRGLVYAPGRFLAIWDHLGGQGDPDWAVHWHLGCPARLDAPGRAVWLEPTPTESLRMTLPEGGGVELFEGSRDPVLGLRSRSYGSIEPCATIVCRPPRGARREALSIVWLQQRDPGVDELHRQLARFRGLVESSSR